jgi:CrcB protein
MHRMDAQRRRRVPPCARKRRTSIACRMPGVKTVNAGTWRDWRSSVLVAAGGALGAICHHGVDTLLPPPSRDDPVLPVGTLVVNVAGAALLGVLLGVSRRRGDRPLWLRPFAAIGFCGAFTTLSAVAIEWWLLVEATRPLVGAGFLLLSVVLGVAAAAVGAMLVERARREAPRSHAGGVP